MTALLYAAAIIPFTVAIALVIAVAVAAEYDKYEKGAAKDDRP